jgi:hypothetical protein
VALYSVGSVEVGGVCAFSVAVVFGRFLLCWCSDCGVVLSGCFIQPSA